MDTKKKSAVRRVLLFMLQDLTRRQHFALKQPWHGTLCIPFSSLVAPKAPSSTRASPRRQQGHLQISQLPHHRPAAQLCQDRTPHRPSQHQHHKSPLARRFRKHTTQTSEHRRSTRLATCSSPRQTTTRPASGCTSGPAMQPRSLPRATPSLPLRAQTTRQRTRTMHSLCPASAAPPPSQLQVRAVGGGTRPTPWAARTAEWVPVRTTISFLDSVAAAAAAPVRYPGWAVAGVGS